MTKTIIIFYFILSRHIRLEIIDVAKFRTQETPFSQLQFRLQPNHKGITLMDPTNSNYQHHLDRVTSSTFDQLIAHYFIALKFMVIA